MPAARLELEVMAPASETAAWLAAVIARQPSDPDVPLGTPGYTTPTPLRRRTGWAGSSRADLAPTCAAVGQQRSARHVYDRNMEPKMLLWLARATSRPVEIVDAAEQDAAMANTMAAQSAAIRKRNPWERLAEALRARA